MKVLDDNSPMPFGRYEGRRLGYVPAGFLLTIRKYDWLEKDHPALADYIDEHKEALEQELEETLRQKLNETGS